MGSIGKYAQQQSPTESTTAMTNLSVKTIDERPRITNEFKVYELNGTLQFKRCTGTIEKSNALNNNSNEEKKVKHLRYIVQGKF